MPPDYGKAHRLLRDQLLAALVPGQPCPQPLPPDGQPCRLPLLPGQALELGHDSLGGYLGLVHAACNRRWGAHIGGLRRRRPCHRCRKDYRPTYRGQRYCPACLRRWPELTGGSGRPW